MAWDDDKNLEPWTCKKTAFSGDLIPFACPKTSFDQGLGEWEFEPSNADNEYNEGNLISHVLDPVWDLEDHTHDPVTPTHVPCGYWTREANPQNQFVMTVSSTGVVGNSIAYSDVLGMWCAVGDLGTCFTSIDDGITWVPQTITGATDALKKVRYVNGQFLAVGLDGVFTSIDGITWIDKGFARELNTFTYNQAEGLYYVGETVEAKTWSSPDLVTFDYSFRYGSAIPLDFESNLSVSVGSLSGGNIVRVSEPQELFGALTPNHSKIAYGHGLFIHNKLRSPDGTEWIDQDHEFYCCGFGNDLFISGIYDVTVGTDVVRNAAYSFDGIHWSGITTDFFDDGIDAHMLDVAVSDTRYIMLSNNANASHIGIFEVL